MDFEQEQIFRRARLRRVRIAALRRRRAVCELRRQIDFKTMWADPAPTQKYGYAFGSSTDYCGLFGTTASGPTGLARNATAGLLNASTGTHNKISTPIG